MIALIGNLTLFIALLLQLSITVVKIWKQHIYKENITLLTQLHLASTVAILSSLMTLIYGFVTHGYELVTVYQNSDNSMSTIELIVATWAGREGVLLLWATLASFFTLFLLYYFSQDMDNPVINRAISIQLVMNTFITAFNLAGGSTPFVTGQDAINGLGISPSLDSIWQQVHPPLAFMAYSSFIFPYALAIAALIGLGKSESIPSVPLVIARRMMMLGWGCVNLLIIAGSIWAYEANWNGFWAWDPIEVASLVMWVLVTAYFHSSSLVNSASHPLKLTTLGFGWIGVSFASFVVRSGLWEGFHGYVGIEKAIVFGSIFFASVLGLGYGIRQSKTTIFPDILYQTSEKLPHVATFWVLLGLAGINAVGLVVQLINNLGFRDDTIPYEYYMLLNGLGFLSLVVLFLACDVNRSFPNKQYIGIALLVGLVIGGFIFTTHLISQVVIYLLAIIVFSVLFVQLLGVGLNISRRKEVRRIRTQIIHLAIILLLLPYFMVDYGSTTLNIEVPPEEEITVDEFGITFTLFKQTENLDAPYPFYLLEITDDEGKQHELEIHQGQYKGQFWSRGTWFSQTDRDIYFMLLDPNSGFIIDPQAPVNLQITEKPYAHLFRIALFFHLFVFAIIIISIVQPIKLRSNEPRKVENITLISDT